MTEYEARINSLTNFSESYQYLAQSQTTDVFNADMINKCEQCQPGEHLDESVTVTGRITLKRNAGKIVFSVLRNFPHQEASETSVQLFLTPAMIESEVIALFKHQVHLGDILTVTGHLGLSQSGEKSLYVTKFSMNAKCLNPYPKESGLELNRATMTANPVLHMLMDKNHRDKIRARSQIISQVRNYFIKENFLEVDTPTLSTQVGGAEAERFTTHAHALDEAMFLRVAPELYLKQLVIGGIGDVFEIGKNYRNEGVDRTHSPEFLALEAYRVGSDYHDQAQLVERLVHRLYEAQELEPLSVRQESFYGLLSASLGVDESFFVNASTEALECLAGIHNVSAENKNSGEIAEALFDELIVPSFCHEAIFVFDYPTETSPLAMPRGDGTSQKWDLYIDGMELATAYTECSEPSFLAPRFEDDPSFIEAVHYGMPHMGGLGIGLDRLVMLITNSKNIHEAQAFPHRAV